MPPSFIAYIWLAWFASVLSSFLAIEVWAIVNGQMTLSQTIEAATTAHPVIPFIFGLIVGALAMHFWHAR